MSSVGCLVHLAAPSVRVGGVIRQRCAWCGALIDEVDLGRVAWVAEDGDPGFVDGDGNPRSRWSGLVAVEVVEGVVSSRCAVADPGDGKVPDDSCMALDPVVTS
jgi:hypothetical protein